MKIEDPLHIAAASREKKSKGNRGLKPRIRKDVREEKIEYDEIEETAERLKELEKQLIEVEHDLFIGSDVVRSKEIYALEREIEKAQGELKKLMDPEGDEE